MQEPYAGTVWINPEVITRTDPTTFRGLTDAGRHDRQAYDRRTEQWGVINAYVFDAHYDDGLFVEVHVNPEYGSTSAAEHVAARYARIVGQMPTGVRVGVNTLTVHKGDKLFGGGNNNILIHQDHADESMAKGFLEEEILHEAAHAALDPDHLHAADWRKAQRADGKYISTYARDNPDREDLAESFSVWFMVRFRRERTPDAMLRTILHTIPNRLAYFDALPLDMYPYGG